MKVLITTDWYVPAVNGVVTSVLNLQRELTAQGHEVRVLTLSNSLRSCKVDGVYALGSIPTGLVYPGARLRTAPTERIVREILSWQPDIVHSQCEFSTFLLARHISRTLNVPLVHTYHTVYENYTHYFSPSVSLGRKTVRGVTRWIAAQSDALIAPTEKVAAMLRGYGVNCPVFVVPSGIDLRRFQQTVPPKELEALKAQLGIPAGYLVLVCVGRLAEEKNIGELLTNLTFFQQQPVKLLLVGDGPYRTELEQQAETLGVSSQVIFAGMVPPEQVAAYYQLGDLFVSASTSETQGLTYIEALASGLPALCREDDCLNGVIENGVNGWQYRDADEFQQYLRLFLEQKQLRETLGQQAARSAAQFSAERFAGRIGQIYQQELLLHNHRPVTARSSAHE